jgi:hypothetical protein
MSPHIQKVSLIFRYLFLFVFIALPIHHLILWFFTPDHTLTFLGGGIGMVSKAIPDNVQIAYQMGFFTNLLACLVDAIPLIFMELIFYWLIRLFVLYEKAEIFSLKNVSYIKRIACALIILQFVKPFVEGLLTFVLTWQNPPGQDLRFISMSFHNTSSGLLVVGVLVLLVSWVMAEGARMREEQQLTI